MRHPWRMSHEASAGPGPSAGGADATDVAEAPGGYNLAGLAHKALSEMVRTRRLRGGDVIIEAKLAEVLGVSRTPLREALQRLEGEGLVVKAANRSFMVRSVELSEYLQSLTMRELLEGEAAALAVSRIPAPALRAARHGVDELLSAKDYHTDAHWQSDDAVHGLSIDHCGNAVMAQIIRALRVTTRMFEIARLSDRIGPDSAEHLAMLDGLESGDPRKARKAVQAHVRSLYRFALGNLGRDPAQSGRRTNATPLAVTIAAPSRVAPPGTSPNTA